MKGGLSMQVIKDTLKISLICFLVIIATVAILFGPVLVLPTFIGAAVTFIMMLMTLSYMIASSWR